MRSDTVAAELDDLKAPPYSEESEQATLGAMLIDRDALEYGLEHLKSADFYETRNAKIFAAMSLLHSKGKAVDLSTVAAMLRTEETLAHVGGAEYLMSLTAGVSTAAHIESYVRFVKEKSMLRAVIAASTESIQSCYRQVEEPEAIIEQAEQAIYSIASKHDRKEMNMIADAVTTMSLQLESLHDNRTQTPGLKTGFTEFDQLTGGLHPGQLIVIAARPGAGKTAFALNIAENVGIMQKLPVLFYSLEMTQEEIVRRLLSSQTGIGLYQIRTGFWPPASWKLINDKSALMHEAPIVLADQCNGLTAMAVRASARRWFTKLRRGGHKSGLIVVDYLQLMEGGGKRTENRNLEVAQISRTLKQTALDLQVPVIALSQLNRSTESQTRDGRPQLSDLRDSGAIEQDADIVGFIYRPGMYKKGATQEERAETEFLIAKHRNGALGSIKMHFNGDITKFYERP